MWQNPDLFCLSLANFVLLQHLQSCICSLLSFSQPAREIKGRLHLSFFTFFILQVGSKTRSYANEQCFSVTDTEYEKSFIMNQLKVERYLDFTSGETSHIVASRNSVQQSIHVLQVHIFDPKGPILYILGGWENKCILALEPVP